MTPAFQRLLRCAGAAFVMAIPHLHAAPDSKPEAGGHVLATKHDALSKGTLFTTTRTIACEKLTMKVTMGAETTESTITRKDTRVESLEGLGEGKVRRILTASDTEGESNTNGVKQALPREADPLIGVPVVVAQDAGKWSASLEKGEPFQTQASYLKKLEQTFAGDPAFATYGDALRKPGDKWEVGPAAFCPANFGGFADADKVEGKITVEFKEEKVYQGTPCALLKLTFDVKGQPKGAGDKGEFTFKGEGKVLRSLRDKMDLAWEHKGRIRITETAGERPAMSLEGPIMVSGLAEVKRP